LRDGRSWAATSIPINAFEQKVRTSGRFSIYVRCAPFEKHLGARIVSISPPDQPSDIEIRQESSDLAIWFHNRFSFYPYRLQWSFPNVFAANQVHDILFTYDGAKLSLYWDGKYVRTHYDLGPWASLAWHIRQPEVAELDAYRYAYYAFIFCPIGCVAGLTWRKARSALPRLLVVSLGVVLPRFCSKLFWSSPATPRSPSTIYSWPS
jgi:hypothetical protein